jgi:hypothetical protein
MDGGWRIVMGVRWPQVEWGVVKECENLLKKSPGGSFNIGQDRDAAVKG